MTWGDVQSVTFGEKGYLSLVNSILTWGEEKRDRTGVGTRSVFGANLEFDLHHDFPLLTTKTVNFEAVVKELFWFLRGETNIKTLGCKIWDEWADDTGECGPIYGWQWRNFGGLHPKAFKVQRSKGIDQIAMLVDTMRSNPLSRRMVVSAWNPEDLEHMALPPCHTMFQVSCSEAFNQFDPAYANDEKAYWVDLQMYQRSADIALGVPFNIASYALLTHILCKAAGPTYAPRSLRIVFGDVHAYSNHAAGLWEQCSRHIRKFPQVRINKVPDLSAPEKFNLKLEDIELTAYNPHPPIKFKVAV